MSVVIRPFEPSDIAAVVSLFYETVHAVNKQHYAPEQLEAWAPRGEEARRAEAWLGSLTRNIALVAHKSGRIVGFADMTEDGHLDRLYVHKDNQRQGIATLLANELEAAAKKRGIAELHTEASITARPFFERRGYRVTQARTVERKGVRLDNFGMNKLL